MKTHYFNARFDKNNEIYIEQTAFYNIGDTIEDIAHNYEYEYAYTLEVTVDEVIRHDWESRGLDLRYEDEEKAENEKRHERIELANLYS